MSLLTWTVTDRATGRDVDSFEAPEDRIAAEREASRLGYPHATHDIRAVLHMGAFQPQRPKRSADGYRAAYRHARRNDA